LIIARFSHLGQIHFGLIEGDQVSVQSGDPYSGLRPAGKTLPLDQVQLLAPVTPSKVVCIGMNYLAHAEEIGIAVPAEPLIFFKPTSAIVGPEESIVLPRQSSKVELECELTVVISRPAKNVSVDDALDYVLGYTIANDVTARDLQFSDLQWARSKAFDSFCPIGPWIQTEFDFSGARISSEVNGEVRQDSLTSDMIFDIPTIVSYVSQNFTLYPGDVILTGSPSGISKISSGDLVECAVEGIGVLRNPVT
jgi:2-keto-4-pentenoate hydratase/2-oxohepta-3-ene-1,7-dioic acid hydratase in catechol pathway